MLWGWESYAKYMTGSAKLEREVGVWGGGGEGELEIGPGHPPSLYETL